MYASPRFPPLVLIGSRPCGARRAPSATNMFRSPGAQNPISAIAISTEPVKFSYNWATSTAAGCTPARFHNIVATVR